MLLEELTALILVLGMTLLCARDFRTRFWPKFQEEKTFQHLTYAVVLALFLLWSARAGVKEGLTIHFLALTTLTMMYGWRSAFIITIPVTLALAVTGKLHYADIPEYLLLSSALPIVISYAIFALSYHYLPRNIFVFIFVAGFFNGAATGALHILINSGYYWLLQAHDWETIKNNYLILLPLMLFPEGLLNGMALAVLSVFKPEWLRCVFR